MPYPFSCSKPRFGLSSRREEWRNYHESAPIESSEGFTLIELMVAVVIVAVLATVAVVSMKKYSQRARTQEAINFLWG